MLGKKGEQSKKNYKIVNCELLTLTYGAIVSQIIKDSNSIPEANEKIENFGYNIGVRLIDEYLAKSNQKVCSSFREVAESIAKNGFDMFLGTKCDIQNFQTIQSTDKQQVTSAKFSLVIVDNPLVDFVELPDHLDGIHYSNIICGILRGSLEMIQISCICSFLKDSLKGDDITEIAIELGKIQEQQQ